MTDLAHVRHGQGCVRPYLHGPVGLIDFLTSVFGATELERHEFGPESFHVELAIGDGVIALEAGALPDDVSPWTGSVYVYVTDVDGAYARAIAQGADPVAQPADKPYGERNAGVRDMAGNTWWMGSVLPPGH